MSEPVRLAQAIINTLPPSTPTGRMAEATINSVIVARNQSGVDELLSVVVNFPSGEQDCRWLGAFANEILSEPLRAWQGQLVALQLTGNRPVVHGSITAPAAADPQPEDDDYGL